MRELNLLEETFLSADSEWSVGHSGVLAFFDRAGRPEPSIDEVRAHVAERVARIEALQWKVVPHPSRPGRRCLVEAGPPDLEYHVREAPVPAPGGQREVGRVAAELNDRSLDREHALWELHVLRGARGPRLPVLVKLHHAIADGATTVEVWEGLFGADPAAPPSRPPERGVAGPADDDGAPVEPLAPAPRTRFNGAPSGTHDFAFASLDVEPLQTARRAAGVSFTEGLMAVVAGALRSWLADRGELPAEPLYASLPASLRRSGEEYRFENLLTLLVVRLPTDEPDPLRRLSAGRDALRAAMQRARGRSEAPAPAQPPGPVINLALAALLAAQARMELCGAPWTANYAMGVAPGGVGLHMSFLTHPGQLDVGVHVDRRQGDGGWSIVAALETAIDELELALP